MVGFVVLDFHVFTGARLWDFFSCFSKNSLHVTGMPRNPCLHICLPGEQSTIASPRTGIQIKFLTSFWSNNSQKVVKLFFFFYLVSVDLFCRLEQNPLRNLFGHGPELMTMEHLAAEVRREAAFPSQISMRVKNSEQLCRKNKKS